MELDFLLKIIKQRDVQITQKPKNPKMRVIEEISIFQIADPETGGGAYSIRARSVFVKEKTKQTPLFIR